MNIIRMTNNHITINGYIAEKEEQKEKTRERENEWYMTKHK